MKKEDTGPRERRYARLTARLAQTGPVLQGNITQRTIMRPDPEAPGKERTNGPYYQWTFKVAAKTRTVNLTREQAKLWGQAIRNHRKLEKTIAQMRTVSLRILQEETTGVPPRGKKKR